jgi:hypothetical protein
MADDLRGAAGEEEHTAPVAHGAQGRISDIRPVRQKAVKIGIDMGSMKLEPV